MENERFNQKNKRKGKSTIINSIENLALQELNSIKNLALQERSKLLHSQVKKKIQPMNARGPTKHHKC